MDEDDLVEVFKTQIAKINETLEDLPVKLRRMNEVVQENFDKCQDTTDQKWKLLETHLTEVAQDLDGYRAKFNKDKKTMRDQVDSVKNEFFMLKDDYTAKSEVIKSLAGATSCIIEAS